MNNEMVELRRILDLFEGAGFTVTYVRTRYSAHSFEITIKSETIDEGNSTVDAYKNEPADISGIANLFEKTGYEIIKYEKKWDVVTKYLGTIYLEIAPKEKLCLSHRDPD
jgi:predicted nucleotidyltransferase